MLQLIFVSNRIGMTKEDLVGSYHIKGSNQDAAHSNYTGTLQLALDEHKRIIALWNISDDQIQQGTGFFNDNILVINFYYGNEYKETFTGVVVYKCLSEDILEGFWSEDVGDPQFLGKETAYRVRTSSTLLN